MTYLEASWIFKLDITTVKKKTAGLKPHAKRGKADVFLIRDLAPYLVKPIGDMEQFLKNASPGDLPAILTKEYWNGQRARQQALLNEGQLWRTDRVVELLSRTFKTLRTGLLLIPDELERKTALSEAQRTEIKAQIDNALEAMRDNLLGDFGGEPTPDERPGTFAERPVVDDTFDLPESDADPGDAFAFDSGEGSGEDEDYDDTFDL